MCRVQKNAQRSSLIAHRLQRLNGQAVAVETEAADDALATRADEALVAELLALVHVADMYLDGRCLHCLQGIEQGHAGMGVGSGVEHDAVEVKPHLVYLVDETSLVIALVVAYLDVGIALLKLLEVAFEALVTIDAGFSFAQQVEIRTVNNLYFHLFLLLLRRQKYEEIRENPNK